jgi:hypothetical protein
MKWNSLGTSNVLDTRLNMLKNVKARVEQLLNFVGRRVKLNPLSHETNGGLC